MCSQGFFFTITICCNIGVLGSEYMYLHGFAHGWDKYFLLVMSSHECKLNRPLHMQLNIPLASFIYIQPIHIFLHRATVRRTSLCCSHGLAVLIAAENFSPFITYTGRGTHTSVCIYFLTKIFS